MRIGILRHFLTILLTTAQQFSGGFLHSSSKTKLGNLRSWGCISTKQGKRGKSTNLQITFAVSHLPNLAKKKKSFVFFFQIRYLCFFFLEISSLLRTGWELMHIYADQVNADCHLKHNLVFLSTSSLPLFSFNSYPACFSWASLLREFLLVFRNLFWET